MKLQKFEFLLKRIDYPYSEELLLNTEQRLIFIEHLLKLHSETLFQYCQIDHSDEASRIKAIKCQLMLTGIWGQSKHGKNVDLNKLIVGICSYESSLQFIYSLTKLVYNNSQTFDTNTSILKDCLQIPYQLINTTYDPFIQTLPKEQEFIDMEKLQLIEDQVNEIQELQEQDLQKLKDRLGEESNPKELGNINEQQKSDYIKQMKKINVMLQDLSNQNNILEQLQQQTSINDDPKYTLNFPQEYTNVLQEFNQLKCSIAKTEPIPSVTEVKEKIIQLNDNELYFIQ